MPESAPLPEAQELAKLRKINAALMRRVETATDISGSGYALFQTAIALENEVRDRTRDLRRTLTDLSEANAKLKAAKEEAERARADLANAIEAVQEGFALFSPDDRLVMCNRPFRTRFRRLDTHITPGMDFEEYIRLVSESDDLVLRPGMTRQDWIAMRRDNHGRTHATFVQPLAGDVWMQISERRTPNGGAAILQTDITDQMRWERRERDKQLDEQDRLVRATLEHLSQGVCVFDSSRTLLVWNSPFRELLGLPFDMLKTGVSFEKIAAFIRGNGLVTSRDAAQRVLDWVLDSGERQPLTVELRRADGMVLDCRGRLTPRGGFVFSFTDRTAEVAAAEALRRAMESLEMRVAERTSELTEVNRQLTQEIAERRQIEEALREAKNAAEGANVSKTRFLAAASHDLLQPLNAARLFISALNESPLPPEPAGLIGKIDSAFDSVEGLLNALLDISKLDTGAVETRIADFPIAAILDPVANEFHAIAARKRLDLRVISSSAVVRSDPGLLRRVVQNLVSNAVRYTLTGRILVGCRRVGTDLRIEVWDTGIGMREQDTAAIFEEFRRLENGAAGSERGAGLGLAIVERACRMLGHPLCLRTRLGRGSMFGVTVPVVTYARRDPSANADAGELLEDGGDMIALMVEDDESIQQGMVTLLERWGVSVLVTGSTDEALAACATLGMAPDMVLADYHLGGSDTGLASIEAIRTAYGAAVPAILITADRSNEVAQRAREQRVELLTKPVRPAALRALISWASRQRRVAG